MHMPVDYEQNIYSNPQKHGLQIVGELNALHACYDFDMFVVWQDEKDSGMVYYDTDSGCSCPSPFERVEAREQLTRVESRAALRNAAIAWRDGICDEDDRPGLSAIDELVQRVNPHG